MLAAHHYANLTRFSPCFGGIVGAAIPTPGCASAIWPPPWLTTVAPMSNMTTSSTMNDTTVASTSSSRHCPHVATTTDNSAQQPRANFHSNFRSAQSSSSSTSIMSGIIYKINVLQILVILSGLSANRNENSTKLTTKQSTIKKYKCDVCQKTFSRSNTLITHKVGLFIRFI